MHRSLLALCLLLGAAPVVARAQQAGRITGRVTDASSGGPVENAQVTISGTRLGTQSGQDGSYTIANVPAGAHTLLAKRLGYAPAQQDVNVSAGAPVTADFKLKPIALTLSATVVTGTTAPTEKRALGNSITSVAGTEIESSNSTTADGALQGMIAGAQVTQNSGNPGGGGISVRLRGTSSLISGSEPLYVIDGVIVDNNSDQLINLGARSNVQNRLADLDPDDIDHIEVIRGAAAAALYGSRANNGVIQIFTKHGREGPPRITLSSRYTSQSTPERLKLNLYPFDSLGGSPVKRYDYQDEIFHTGYVADNHLSLSGGDARSTYYISGGWTRDDGIMRASSADRKSVRLNLTQQLYSTLRLTVGGDFTRTHDEFLPNGEQTMGVLTAVLFTPTTYSYFPVGGAYPRAYLGGAFSNPLDVIANWTAPQDVSRFSGNARLDFNPFQHLAVSYTLGYDGYQLEADQYIPRGSLAAQPTGSSAAVLRNSRILDNSGVATLTTPAGAMTFQSSVGFNYTDQHLTATSASSQDLFPTGTLVSAGATPFAGQGITEMATLGFYGQEVLNWRDRLYLTGAVRWDASSTFGADQRWQLYPKLSASYVMSDESWFKESGIHNAFSSLRLRGALGYAGNQPSLANAYAQYDSYARAVSGTRVGVVNTLVLGNPDLKPERQREFEFGADMGFAKDRVSLEATYYDKKLTDLLLIAPLPTSSGFTSQYQNVGAMTNKGVELTLQTINVETPTLRWTTRATYSANRNKVTELVAPFTVGYINRVSVGQPVGYFYGQYYQRNADGSIKTDSLGKPLRSGLDPSIPASKKIGDPNPDWIGSLLNEFQLGRRLSARVLFDGTFGNQALDLTRRILDADGTGADAALQLAGKLPKGYLAARLPIFEEYVEDASFVKLREVSVSYSLNDVAKRLGLSAWSVTVSGRNLHTWTKYRGLDPEINLFGQNTVERGNDFAGIPIPRSFGISTSITY
jgi:TonB-dependent SusC/RagA subfamily outer membrane receptor